MHQCPASRDRCLGHGAQGAPGAPARGRPSRREGSARVRQPGRSPIFRGYRAAAVL